MIGGFDEYDYDSKTTTELIDQFASISGPDLPWGFSRHCATKITEFTAIIIGGSEKPQGTLWLTYFPNHYNNTEEGPNLIGDGRINHACAHIRANNGSDYVIAAGGLSNGVVLNTSEILLVSAVSNSWRPGKVPIIYSL